MSVWWELQIMHGREEMLTDRSNTKAESVKALLVASAIV